MLDEGGGGKRGEIQSRPSTIIVITFLDLIIKLKSSLKRSALGELIERVKGVERVAVGEYLCVKKEE